jgi:hypothetical protein
MHTISTTTESPFIAVTTPINVNSSQCKPENVAVQSSIKNSTMFLYFVVKQTETISVEEIIAALKNMKPPITLFSICETPSSFNSTLSVVEPPVKINIDLGVLAFQASISSLLQISVNEAAGVFLPPLSSIEYSTQITG